MPRSKASIVEDQIVRLFKRCVQCPPQMPACSSCAAGQTCSLVPADCNNCAYTSCTGAPTSPGTPVSAIAGGVVGGIILLSIIGILAWWLRRKRHLEHPEEFSDPQEWDDASLAHEKNELNNRYSSRLNARASVHTVASVASSNVTGRASNIIQIAYIPGVTNRSHSSPDLVPPVPPIPAASGGSSRLSHGGTSRASQADQLLFLPGDLRHSTFSDYSTRDSVATSRNSVASTVYRNNAIVNPMPAQAVNLIKTTAVSVKTNDKNSPSLSRSASPPLGGSSSSSVHRPLNNKGSIVGKFVQPKSITVTRKNSHSLRPHGQNAFELDGSNHSISSLSTSINQNSGPASPSHSHAPTSFDYSSSDDESGQNTRLVELPANKTLKPKPTYSRPEDSGSSTPLNQSGISRAIQDSMSRAMQTNMGSPRTPAESSPFSDEHETRTP